MQKTNAIQQNKSNAIKIRQFETKCWTENKFVTQKIMNETNLRNSLQRWLSTKSYKYAYSNTGTSKISVFFPFSAHGVNGSNDNISFPVSLLRNSRPCSEPTGKSKCQIWSKRLVCDLTLQVVNVLALTEHQLSSRQISISLIEIQ